MPITTSILMPVIPRPANAPPLFGGKTVILFGGINIEAMRRWQEQARATKGHVHEPLFSGASGKADEAGDHNDGGSVGGWNMSFPDDAAD